MKLNVSMVKDLTEFSIKKYAKHVQEYKHGTNSANLIALDRINIYTYICYMQLVHADLSKNIVNIYLHVAHNDTVTPIPLEFSAKAKIDKMNLAQLKQCITKSMMATNRINSKSNAYNLAKENA